jgi:hypothetical protein
MKKVILLIALSILAKVDAQVIFYVEAPSPNEGNYEITYAVPGTWGVADLSNPDNAIIGYPMQLIDDEMGLENPIACSSVLDLTDKVAVLYRGTCEFGTKALNAQLAGARAVIIINNLAGAPVTMGAGADGAAVTIPVIMISAIDGALLRPEAEAGTTEVFIGSKNGLYANDLGINDGDFLRAERFGNLQQLSQSGSEFEVEMGSWVRNFGSNAQTGVVLTATIGVEGGEIYNESSDPVSIPSGDSVFIPLPTFTQATYANGYYHVDYSVEADAADESDYDNSAEADFNMSDDLFSMAALDEATSIPVNSTNQFNGTTDNLFSCLYFQDPNASRLGVKSMNFSAGTSQNPVVSSITGEIFDIYLYEWNDEWVDLDDPGFALADINDIANGEYIYITDAQGENVNVLFEEPVMLEDNQKYLFCVQMYGSIIYPGYDTKTDYRWNVETYRMPTSPAYTSGQWFALGFGTDFNPSISVEMFNADELNLVEIPEMELIAFPNPANHIVHIPMVVKEGNIHMTIVDVTGKVVAIQDVTMNGPRLDVDVTAFSAGLYIINLEFADGTKGKLNVAVSK